MKRSVWPLLVVLVSILLLAVQVWPTIDGLRVDHPTPLATNWPGRVLTTSTPTLSPTVGWWHNLLPITATPIPTQTSTPSTARP